MICCLCGTSVFGKTGSEPSAKSESALTSEAKPNEKLKRDVLKLVADTRAGKIAPARPSQFKPTHRNNLSTGAKIGIVAAIGGAIFLIIMFRALNSDND
jgi:hypothetical protein